MGKVIDVTTANIDEAVGFRAGSPWRILGLMGDTRSPVAMEVPTFKESGYAIRGGSMRGFAGPKGMPADVVRQLTAGIKACVDDPAFRDRAATSYLPIRYLAPADYLQTLRSLDTSLRTLWQTNPWNQ
jgi:tripartite-type tricarboxylate transporter receptor subunit TctC